MPEFDKNSHNKKENAKKPREHVKTKRKENIFAALVKGLFPWKGDSKGEVVRKIIFLLSLVVIVYAVIAIINFYFIKDIMLEKELDEWLALRSNYAGDEKITINMKDDTKTSEGESENAEVEIIGEYLENYEANNDFIGWVSIYPIVDYSVMQSDDNEFYLNHNHEKIPTANGTIFTDYEGVFTETERPNNTIIYGHNLRTKYFFQPLVHYTSGIDFLKEHPTIDFDTLYERGTYKIFSIFLTNTDEKHGKVFDYQNYVYFENKVEFDYFVAECLDRSYYYTGVDLEYGDELVTLSTCNFSMFSDMRLVVVARRVRPHESPVMDTEAFIDNSGTEDGKVKRKMFEAYYDTFCPDGWYGRTWDKNYIKDFKDYDKFSQ